MWRYLRIQGFLTAVLLSSSYQTLALDSKMGSTTTKKNLKKNIGGKIWTLVTVQKDGSEVWRDETTKLIWYPALKKRFPSALYKSSVVVENPAQNACLKLGLRLPSQEEFMKADEHGIREVFNDFGKEVFWSSSVYENEGWIFRRFDSPYPYDSDLRANPHHVRCVKGGSSP